jgi:hypothetical protein
MHPKMLTRTPGFVLVLVVPTSPLRAGIANITKGYVGQDLGELSRAAVLVLDFAAKRLYKTA